MRSATRGWEHRIGARRERDRGNLQRDYHGSSCEGTLELLVVLAELVAFRRH